MYITNIKLTNFRNYNEQQITLNPNLNIFYGDNAQGKTNILEAIFLCSIGKSFRTSKDKELIKIVTGIRRCGKSTLFDLYINYLNAKNEPSFRTEKRFGTFRYRIILTQY